MSASHDDTTNHAPFDHSDGQPVVSPRKGRSTRVVVVNDTFLPRGRPPEDTPAVSTHDGRSSHSIGVGDFLPCGRPPEDALPSVHPQGGIAFTATRTGGPPISSRPYATMRVLPPDGNVPEQSRVHAGVAQASTPASVPSIMAMASLSSARNVSRDEVPPSPIIALLVPGAIDHGVVMRGLVASVDQSSVAQTHDGTMTHHKNVFP